MGLLSEGINAVTGAVSTKWKQWYSVEDDRRCRDCLDQTGKIYPIGESMSNILNELPGKILEGVLGMMHLRCRCYIAPMRVIRAGEATLQGKDGADYWIKYQKELPNYYIYYNDLKELGWKTSKAPSKWAPGMMVTGGIYNNYNGHLPSTPGRVWYEADINYVSGRRGTERILYSNDGLIFVTYNHYETFCEIA